MERGQFTPIDASDEEPNKVMLEVLLEDHPELKDHVQTQEDLDRFLIQATVQRAEDFRSRITGKNNAEA
jgi:hypothetical protein